MSPRVDVEHDGAGRYNVWSTTDSVRSVEAWGVGVEEAADLAVTIGTEQGIDVYWGGEAYLMRGASV